MRCIKFNNCNQSNKASYMPFINNFQYSGPNMPPTGTNPGDYPDNNQSIRKIQPYNDFKFSPVKLYSNTVGVLNESQIRPLTNSQYKKHYSFSGYKPLAGSIYSDPGYTLERTNEQSMHNTDSKSGIIGAPYSNNYMSNLAINSDSDERIRLIRLFYFAQPFTDAQEYALAYRKYIHLLKYGTPEEIRNVIKLASNGIYAFKKELKDNEVIHQGIIYDCDKLNKVKSINCLDDIYGTIPHAKCAAKYNYLLGKPYDKCSLSEGCRTGQEFSNGTMVCLNDFRDAAKYGLLDNYAKDVHHNSRTNYYTHDESNLKRRINGNPGKIDGSPTFIEPQSKIEKFSDCGNVGISTFHNGQIQEFDPSLNKGDQPGYFNYWKEYSWDKRYIPGDPEGKYESKINKNKK